MSNFVKSLMFFIFLKILLVSTQEDNFTFLVTGGYRPKSHTLVKHIVSLSRKPSKIYFGSRHFCGGSILSPRIILTAAHCLWDHDSGKQIDKNKIQIVAKTPNRLKKSVHTEIIDVQEFNIHPNYDPKKFCNDLAILRLAVDINEDGVYAQRIELTNGSAKAGKKCTIVGWGRIFHKGPIAADALYADIFVLNTKTCLKFYTSLEKGELCAGDPNDPERDACQGDSGSPLICDSKVAGMVSYGRGCKGEAGVYVDVWYYRDWIAKGVAISVNSINISKILLLPLLVWIVN